MVEHLTKNTIIGYAKGTLTPSDLLSADDHLAICEVCREELAGSQNRKLHQLISQLSIPSEHLIYEQIESYVEGELEPPDAALVETHTKHCTRCASRLEGLREVRKELGGSGFATNVLQLWRSPRYSAPFRIAVIAAAFAIVALILSITNSGPDAELKARLQEIQQQNEKLAQELARLQQPDTTTTASLQDGNGSIRLDGAGNLIGVEAFPEHFRELAKTTLRNGKVPVPFWVGELRSGQEVLMGDSKQVPFDLLSPVGVVVESDRPEFQWEALQGVREYRVTVYDLDFDPVSTGAIQSTSWTPSRNLKRGQTYTWQVTAVQNGTEVASPVPPAPEARFQVLGEKKMVELASLRKTGSHLLVGLALADAGLVEDARKEFEALATANPESHLAKELLASLRE